MRVERDRQSAGPQGLASALDVWLVDRSARVRPSRADRMLRGLSTSANHSRLWIGVGAAMILLGNPAARRAGTRGLVAVALASGIANGIAKPLFPRRRPPDESVPFVRRLVKPPVSSSFPSGHSASAAAFATGVALEYPAAAVAVVPVAAAVGYSRVHIGVHWPSDVVAGAALGAGVALATHRWWAVREDEPALLGPAARIEPLEQGRGLLMVVNPLAGAGSGGGPYDWTLLREQLPEADFVELDPAVGLDAQLEERLRHKDVRGIGVLGGDGTVSSVAGFAVRHRLPLAVLSGGTLNHFARDAGVDDIDDTLAAVRTGQVAACDAALVRSDDSAARTFVNTASLGGYPDFVRLRERWQEHLGKWPAAGISMIRVLLGAEPLHVVIDGQPMAIWMLFVGNGRYHPANQIPRSRPELHRGTLDVRYLRADVPFSRTRLIWSTLTGTLGSSPTYVRHERHRLEVSVTEASVSLATDGEVDFKGRDFVFESQPDTLILFHRDPRTDP
ncbi:bifunctional phosphatase PAP2/diacylglycerol kinase family protein [Nocardia goodfellowii]|uniref:Undecaprenyl-diphosphatase n=1 Tax=Nocardia goodfellowii TaxID=882446 RepID=A0ABS4QF94_9NOCA|nr:bifunctional phosphatase PAP2/diacylglycerol kinase family protein [Nocardia goodfellowii]MBP2189758.1 undecaprenyl-diphosphatase [Nocardia goodfellowii]